MKAVENLIKNSIDKNKIDKLYANSFTEAKNTLKRTKV